MAGPEKIKSILKNIVSIDSLAKIAKTNYELEQILSGAIPPEIEEDVCFGHFENKIITFLASSSVVATKVRFLSPEILREAQNRAPNHDIQGIEIKISLNKLGLNRE
tara:strand:+ start:3597 stop:3917 length:321 start_codon:yes stop_codon:yes gene_type:complete